MECQWLTLCLWVFLILFQYHACLACFQQERIGLLELKASIIKESDVDRLLTWVDDNTSDCCAWIGVKCNNNTHRVVQLSLAGAYDYNNENRLRSVQAPLFVRFLNASLFLPFEELQLLDLSDNHFTGWLHNQGLDRLSKLTKLEDLYLSKNKFNNSILASLVAITSLKTLDLGSNELDGSLSKLSPGFCELKNLEVLDLSRNRFKGIIPPCLKNFTSLRMLDMSDNQLSGSFSPSLISNLTSLVWFSLSENQFDESIMLTTVVEPKFQLRVLDLSNCNLNTSTTYLLKFLNNQYDLRYVDLSHNKLHGAYPNWIVKNNTRLDTLILRNNSLNGHIHFPDIPRIMLRCVDVSKNNIHGELQTNVGDILPNLEYLNLSKNGFEGRIPISVGDMKDLGFLDLSSNNFSGEVPESLTLNFKNLQILILSNNRLHGLLSPLLFNILNTSFTLSTLRLSNNHFTGFLPSNYNVIRSIWFRTLDISQNNISGRIPPWIGTLPWLTTLVLRDNSFDGPIPLELCNLANLNFLDLSQNHLSGSIPSCQTNLTNLEYMHLHGNQLTGSLPKSLLKSPNLVTLDLTRNNLSGSVPNWFGSLQNLRLLLLKGNSLNSSIPRELCQLNKIGILDLSHNKFSGRIPPCFSNITFENTEVVQHATQDLRVLTVQDLSNDNLGGLETKTFQVTDVNLLEQDEVEFITKSRLDSYKGNILNYMTGMDLSCNHFTGDIPLEIGALTGIRALNFSHNQFTGSIPKTLSNLNQLESMDLSHNKLIGEIPSELSGIYTLAVFTVAYNNLSGRTPDMKAQFNTFTETSYEGNPFLCGPPLQKQCNTTTAPDTPVTDTIDGLGEKLGIDPTSFLASLGASCVVTLLGLVLVLYINPYWRRLWFDLVDTCLSFLFPFWSEAINKTSNPRT